MGEEEGKGCGRERVAKGGHKFMKVMKIIIMKIIKKGGGNYAVFYFAGKRII